MQKSKCKKANATKQTKEQPVMNYDLLGLFLHHFGRLPKDDRELAHWYLFEYQR